MPRTYAVDLNDLRDAAKRIEPHAHRTPIITCRTLDEMAGVELSKCENLQRVGAFKFRGACNAVFNLPDEVAQRGVVTHSSGNHGQALALAAQLRGITAHIVMPSNASAVKKAAVEGYGGKVIACDPTLEARETTTANVVRETGGVRIPPYDHPDIIAGQGTTGLELLEQVPDLGAILAPVGGGGLLAGTCIAAEGMKVYGTEPKAADDAARSLEAGKLIPQTGPKTIADGLLTSLGSLTWPIIRDHAAGIITVSEEAIVEAMRLMWMRAKLIIEPSAAVALAAALAHDFGEIKRVGIILSGGNVDLDRLPW